MLPAPPSRTAASDHFDGKRFHNPGENARGFLDILRWIATRRPGPWGRRSVAAAPFPAPPARAADLRATFVNHATVLLQMSGVNVLTDPVWSERVGPLSRIGPRRYRPPGVRFDELPTVHVVAVSHNHYDHMDLPTLRRLYRRDRPIVVTGMGNRRLLERRGIDNVIELDWWQAARVCEGLTVTGVPVRHFSGRGLHDRNRTLWCGFVFSSPAGDVLFTGDTGYSEGFRRIGERFTAMRLAVLPIGAYRPEWFMGPVHASPAQALEIHRALGASTSLGMHFGTFRLADDGQDEPAAEIARLLAAEPEPKSRFWVLENGEARDVP